MFDLMDKPYLPPVEVNTFTNLFAAASVLSFGVPSTGLVPHQFGAAIDAMLGKALTELPDPTPDGITLLQIVNSDFKVTPGVGNGQGDTIYRLKEGNERFMITDVNNPQTSAMAQSTLFAMLDQFGNGSGIQYFNHVPGGCNVLFMDGHVEWIPYVAPAPGQDNTISMDLGGTQPVLPSMANIIGIFQGLN